MSLGAHINEIIEDALGGVMRPVDLLDTFIDRFPDEFLEEADRLARKGLLRQIKEALKKLSDDVDTGQQALPGLGLPRVIAVPEGETGEFYYRDTRLASRDELLAGRVTRVRNIEAAQLKLDEYDDALAALDPYMGEAQPVQGWLRAQGW